MQGSEAAAQAGQTVEQKLALAHEALRKTPGLQFDFGAQPPPPKPPGWLAPLLEFLASLGPILQYVFWGGLAVGVALIIYFIAREFVPETWLRKSRAKQVVTDWRPEAGTARALLEDADGLAAAGRFEEAIHLLLFRSIEDLVARRPGAVRPAFTSRDIAGLEVLPGEARSAFARLAQAVERTFFGGRPADAEEFGRARKDYEAFAFAEGWR
ncbi:DUF4129 domain-containing protein [uncultured Phenylobacterium sp.]|uniref:DUF4129 domain-containing protein n=1 Tax=uncultured Phenylobacterium sp. TaxID=349273 RepID=UPI0025DDB3D4|nr:DUF4129 domain-containing protein [uncultured Phenylobacterium sp.]